MGELKDKAKETIDDAAAAVKKTPSKVVDKSKEVAKAAGEKNEKGGKKLKDA